MTTALYVQPRHVERAADCYFYHRIEIPGNGVRVADLAWDLRHNIDAYLGQVPLRGRRVLDVGTGRGYLTFHMESRGADVVAVELPPSSDWDVVPHHRVDVEAAAAQRREDQLRLHNAFWYAHERFGSRARLHHASAYDLSEALGRFDVAILGSVLLHLRDPLRAIERSAARANTVVVTDRHWSELDGAPVMRLHPTAESALWDTWWALGPEIVAQYLEVLGFATPTITFHEQTFIHPGGEITMPMFTVVGARDRT